MKLSLLGGKKNCYLNENDIVIDFIPYIIYDLKELDYNSNTAIQGIVFMIPTIVWIIWIYTKEYILKFTSLQFSDKIFGSLFLIPIFFLFYILLLAFSAFRYRGRWRYNFTNYIYIEKNEDIELESKLKTLSENIYKNAKKVQCPKCHKILPVSKYDNYVCSQCKIEFCFNGTSDLAILQKNKGLLDKIFIISASIFFTLFLPIDLLNKFSTNFIGKKLMPYMMGSLTIFLFAWTIDCLKYGVYLRVYKNDTPKRFYFCLFCLLSIDVMLIWIITNIYF